MHKVFVYGTLRKGFANHDWYMQGAKFLHPAQVLNYDMLDLGPFPTVKYREGGRVVGEVYEVDDATLRDLDNLEGVNRGMYARVKVKACCELGPDHYELHDCFMYAVGPATYHEIQKRPVVASGDWVRHCEERGVRSWR